MNEPFAGYDVAAVSSDDVLGGVPDGTGAGGRAPVEEQLRDLRRGIDHDRGDRVDRGVPGRCRDEQHGLADCPAGAARHEDAGRLEVVVRIREPEQRCERVVDPARVEIGGRLERLRDLARTGDALRLRPAGTIAPSADESCASVDGCGDGGGSLSRKARNALAEQPGLGL